MSEVRLTNDADYMLCTLYEAYYTRRKNGVLRVDAAMFGSSEKIQKEFIPEWPTDDIDDIARELSQKEMLYCLFADSVLCESVLTPDGIIYMENRFKDRFDGVLRRISDLRSLIFG